MIKMTLIPDDAHVMLAAAVSTKNVVLIADTIMCITDLVTEIQSRFTVAVRPGMGKSMTFRPTKTEAQTAFPCSTCEKQFKSVEELNSHASTHTNDEDVRSATQRLHSLTSGIGLGGGASGDASSWQSATSETSMDKSHSVGEPLGSGEKKEDMNSLICPVCNKMFTKVFQLNIHLAKHQNTPSESESTPRRTYNCRMCNKQFNHLSNRAKHEKICKLNNPGNVTPKPAPSSPSQVFYCKKCRKPYADNANRLRHERLCQTPNRNRCLAYASLTPSKPSGASNSLELPISVNNYKQMASSATYMKVLDENGKQTNMFSCIMCAKLLQTRTSLESHYMSHLGIKPHACQFCDKRFTDSSNWRKHQRTCTERSSADLTNLQHPASMAPPTSAHSAQTGYDFTNIDKAMSSAYQSHTSTAPTTASMAQQSFNPSVKMEAVDITSDSGSPTDVTINYNGSPEDGQLIITAEVEPSSPPFTASPADMEESEEQRDINRANAVVVDSALSWFVTDKDRDEQAVEDASG